MRLVFACTKRTMATGGETRGASSPSEERDDVIDLAIPRRPYTISLWLFPTATLLPRRPWLKRELASGFDKADSARQFPVTFLRA